MNQSIIIDALFLEYEALPTRRQKTPSGCGRSMLRIAQSYFPLGSILPRFDPLISRKSAFVGDASNAKLRHSAAIRVDAE